MDSKDQRNIKISRDTHKAMSVRASELGMLKSELSDILIRAALELPKSKLQKLLKLK